MVPTCYGRQAIRLSSKDLVAHALAVQTLIDSNRKMNLPPRMEGKSFLQEQKTIVKYLLILL